MTPESSLAFEPQSSVKPSFFRVFGWSVLTTIGGALIYSAFTLLTGMETSLIGIPVGLAVGQATYYASGKRGGRWFQVLAVALAFAAFDLTYAPGMASTFLKDGITPAVFGLFIVVTLMSPVIDPANGFLGQFMFFAGMYLAWTLARSRKM